MKTASIIAFTVLAFAGSAAMAQEVGVDTATFAATKTRAEVRADVLKSRTRTPSLVSTEVGADGPATAKGNASTITREQVQAELRKAPRSRREAGFSAA